MIFTLFEDQRYNSLYPLNLNRASFELRCGAFTNLERIENSISPEDNLQLVVRPEIAPLIRERYPTFQVNPEIISPGIWVNGRGIWSEDTLNELSSDKSYTHKGFLLAVHSQISIPLDEFYAHIEKQGLISIDIDQPFLSYVWEGIFLQPEVINSDAKYFLDYKGGNVHPSVVLEKSDSIYIGEGAKVRAGTVLDAESGPIIIAENVYIDIGVLIQGPVYIGPQSVINPGTKLRGNITLGPMCKIGGEVEDVIIQGYSNKQHDGFLGHSYLGEWVNLGANTNNSDLKNNYSNVCISMNEDQIDTGCQFLGALVGDYVRTGISTMLNTGTVIGLGSNIFGAGFQEKVIPSFRWGEHGHTEFNKFLDTAEKMKQRRGKNISSEEKDFLSELYSKQI